MDGWLKRTDIEILDGQWYWTDGWDEQILVYCAKGWDERIFDNIVRRDETDNYRVIVWKAETGELWLKGRINWLEMNTDIKIFFVTWDDITLYRSVCYRYYCYNLWLLFYFVQTTIRSWGFGVPTEMVRNVEEGTKNFHNFYWFGENKWYLRWAGWREVLRCP